MSRNRIDVDDKFCMFCFRETSQHVVFRALRRHLPVCDVCVAAMEAKKIDMNDVRERLKELAEIGVLT